MSNLGPLHNLDNALEFIGDKVVSIQGSRYVKVDDLKEAMGQQREAVIDAALSPRPRTFAEARRLVYADEELMAEFSHEPQAPGSSIAASESQTSSRT